MSDKNQNRLGTWSQRTVAKTAAGNTLTIAAAGSIPIVGPTSLTGLNQWAECLTDGIHWFVFAS